MYNVLLVDDDEKAYMGLKKYIQWNSYGFKVQACADSMQEALKILEQEEIDLVITDIRMPKGSGLELIERLRKHDADVCVGILSAYGEFEYAKSAMKNGALSYLMKPVDFDEMHEFLKETAKILSERQQTNKRYEQFVIEKTLLAMVKNEQRIHQDFFLHKHPWVMDVHPKALVRLQCIKEISKEKKQAFIRRWEEDNQDIEILTIPKSDNEYISLIAVRDKDWLDKIPDFLVASGWIIGISNVHEIASNISKLYDEASRAVYAHSMYPKQVIFYEETKKHLLQGNDLDPVLEAQLQRDLSIENYGKFIERLHEQYNKKALQGSCVEFSLRFMVQIAALVQRYFIEHQKYTKIQELIYSMTRNIVLCNSSERIFDEAIQTFEAVFELCARSKNSSGIIEKAKAYIEVNYDKEISLEIVADYIYIHPIYLSRLFKERTGDKFSSYLTHVRLAKAKELLKEKSLKTYQISEMIGYESSKYFSRVFKENIGCSPREYRRSLGNS